MLDGKRSEGGISYLYAVVSSCKDDDDEDLKQKKKKKN
jgi:hypothetical protein